MGGIRPSLQEFLGSVGIFLRINCEHGIDWIDCPELLNISLSPDHPSSIASSASSSTTCDSRRALLPIVSIPESPAAL